MRKVEGIMKCPECSGGNLKVIDSRPAYEYSAIRRRRVCVLCGHRFTTYEYSDINKASYKKGYNDALAKIKPLIREALCVN